LGQTLPELTFRTRRPCLICFSFFGSSDFQQEKFGFEICSTWIKPNQSFMMADSPVADEFLPCWHRIPLGIRIHGVRISRTWRSQRYLTPQSIKRQGPSSMLDIGAYFYANHIVFWVCVPRITYKPVKTKESGNAIVDWCSSESPKRAKTLVQLRYIRSRQFRNSVRRSANEITSSWICRIAIRKSLEEGIPSSLSLILKLHDRFY